MVRAELISVHWHSWFNQQTEKFIANEPILSCSFDHSENSERPVLITSGADKTIKIWTVNFDFNAGEDKKNKNKNDNERVEYKQTIKNHTTNVNCVRFSKSGEMIASCADQGECFVFCRRLEKVLEVDKITKEEQMSEWKCERTLRGGNEDAIDLSWSPDSKAIAVSYIDWKIVVFDSMKGDALVELGGKRTPRAKGGHTSFVQGVAFDTLQKWIVTVSADRTMCVYASNKVAKSKNDKSKIWASSSFAYKQTAKSAKRIIDSEKNENANDDMSLMLFHDDTLPSFFRRPAFSPCGSFLVVPSGIITEKDEGVKLRVVRNCAHVFSRKDLTVPLISLPSLKPSTCVQFSPKVYKRRNNNNNNDNNINNDDSSNNAFRGLTHRCIFCVCTIDGCEVWDTEKSTPIVFIANAHYAAVTDCAWSADGETLVLTSKDGFASFIKFESGELGEEVELPKIIEEEDFEKEESSKENEKKVEQQQQQKIVEVFFNKSIVPESEVKENEKSNVNAPRRISPIAM